MMSESNISNDRDRRIRRVPSDNKTRLDKYKHLIYDEEVYESDEFMDDLDKKSKIQRKQKPN
jgi:hypothetical protein|tara:strand:- start:1252 stop:1437 length:186 start_codon:yes stop_codon:yes gene_type:complete